MPAGRTGRQGMDRTASRQSDQMGEASGQGASDGNSQGKDIEFIDL